MHSCATCRYWDVRDPKTLGLCRSVEPTLRDGSRGEWPETSSSDWCGEWERAGNEQRVESKPYHGLHPVLAVILTVASVMFAAIGVSSASVLAIMFAIVSAWISGAVFCDSCFHGWYMSKASPQNAEEE